MTALAAGHRERALRRSVAVNAVGLLARGTHVALLFAVSRALGAEALGCFLLGMGLFEIATAVVVTGFTDGTMLLASRGAARHPAGDSHGSEALADVVATALLVGGGLAMFLAVTATVLIPAIASHVPVAYAEVMPSAIFLAWALVPALVARVAFAATTAFFRLEWEVVVGSAGPPLGVLLALPALRALGGGARGLFAAALGAQIALAVVGVTVLRRHLPLAALGAALRRARVDRALLRFALPQALNMAATTYLTRIDILLLAGFGTPAAAVGRYGAIATLVLELRQARLLFTGGLGAVVARDHAAGARGDLARTLSRAAAWAAGTAVPLALGFVVVRRDVLALVAPGFGTGDTRFVLVLLLGPLASCFGGLAGNYLVYLLRNRFNLGNSILVGVTSTALGCWLVPRFGIDGAAACAALGLASITVLENLELWAVERVRIAPRALAPAAATLAVGALVLWAIDGVGAPPRGDIRLDLALAVALVAVLAIKGGPRLRGPKRLESIR